MAHLAKPLIPDYIGHGWAMEDDVIVQVFFEFFEGMTALDKLQVSFVDALALRSARVRENALASRMIVMLRCVLL